MLDDAVIEFKNWDRQFLSRGVLVLGMPGQGKTSSLGVLRGRAAALAALTIAAHRGLADHVVLICPHAAVDVTPCFNYGTSLADAHDEKSDSFTWLPASATGPSVALAAEAGSEKPLSVNSKVEPLAVA